MIGANAKLITVVALFIVAALTCRYADRTLP